MAKRKLRAIAGPVFAAALFILAVRLLIHEAHSITWDDFMEGLSGVPPLYLAFAAFLISLNYGLLISYDLLAPEQESSASLKDLPKVRPGTRHFDC